MSATVAVVLGIAGAGMLGYAVGQQHHAPQPAARSTPSNGPTIAAGAGLASSGSLLAPPSPPPAEPTPPTSAVVALPPATPITIRIPAINVASPITTVGLNPDHTMQVPSPGRTYNQAAWYRYSPTPGQLGPAVIIGHVDSAKDGPSVFFNLGALSPGQRITITRADATTATFAVDAVASYTKHTFPTHTVYAATTYPALRLITCGGPFDTHTGQYLNNTVVFAHLAN